MGLDIDAATAFRVVSAAEAGDIHHASLVDVHHTGCEGREGGMAQTSSGWSNLGHQVSAVLGPLVPSCTLEIVPPSIEQATLPASYQKDFSKSFSQP